MRFKATLDAPGCWKATEAFWPMLKVFQLAIILSVCWLIVMALPAWLMAAVPATTWPPVGRAWGSRAFAVPPAASRADNTRAPTVRGRRNHPAATFSETAIHISRERDQISR